MLSGPKQNYLHPWQTTVPLSSSHLDEAVSSTGQFQLLVNGFQLEVEESEFISFLARDVVPSSGAQDLHRSCIILYCVDRRLPIHFYLSQKFNIQFLFLCSLYNSFSLKITEEC